MLQLLFFGVSKRTNEDWVSHECHYSDSHDTYPGCALGESLPAGETSGLVEEEAADSVTIRVMGWLLATARSKSGMLSVWTEAVLAKAGGNLWLVSRRCGYNQPRRLKAK